MALTTISKLFLEIISMLHRFINPLQRMSISNEGMELTVSVLEAKGLMCPFSVESLDTFVRIYLVPDHPGAMQTKVKLN